MKAVRFSAYGGPDVLCLVDVAGPHAGPGPLRIAVRSVGVNPSDWKRRAGLYRDFEPLTFPSGVGVEASGVVDEVGPGVTGVSVGDAVFGYGVDTAARFAVLTHWAHKPGDLPFEVAAGGLGTAVLQFARHRGITVIGTASPQKQDYVTELGAIPTTYGPGLAARVGTLAPAGVDRALDLAGQGVIPELIAVVGDASRVLSVADFEAPRYGAKFSAGPPKNPGRIFADVVRLWSQGLFRLPVLRVFPLDAVREAHVVSATGHVTGKPVLSVA